MEHIVNMLNAVPDLRREKAVAAWAEPEARHIAAFDFNPAHMESVASITPRDAARTALVLDPALLNRFVLCLLAVDWACYTEPANREDYLHLHQAVTVFPKGFRLWTANADDRVLPIGYTAFHPISPATFALLRDAPHTITNRHKITPQSQTSSGEQYCYLYNIGILPWFHRTEASRALLRAFREDVDAVPYRGLAAIVVSPDGKRVIERFGLRQSGVITHDGHEELAYVSDQ
ncbi:MAG: hypothetical protein B193_3199 [Solidesulfovibrio magneticus str. Maddingley MBC34]|uniref:N-acetyltransferase domain-containing protein n=1 Tax=Solidesulfovibrio magneticus str. Maddingley MBC34 TaxID=1206767 RepID=K6GMD8_9BACT|nr:MAG: hypothetical protein B193_3199 [Solidesulfovibrio magneticus str. Maddingley MBC34]